MNRKEVDKFLRRTMAGFHGDSGNLKCHLSEQFLKKYFKS